MIQLPQFPIFRPVSLDDRGPLEKIFREMVPEVSELNFTNIFMFRCVHHYSLSELNGNIVILAKSYFDDHYFLPPIGDKDIPETMDEMFSHMRGEGMRPLICMAWKGFVDAHVGEGRYYTAVDDDDSDYVYDYEEMTQFPGRKFHDKKNLLNRFLRKHEHEYKRLTKELVPGAEDLVERWCKEKCTVETPSTFGETEATMCALKNLEELSTRGGVVVINGNVEALAMGEELSPGTVVVHVEKANSAFQGLYQFLSSEFLKREFEGFKYVNREQDLGEPNLRKSKRSYNPVKMVEKYRIWPKG